MQLGLHVSLVNVLQNIKYKSLEDAITKELDIFGLNTVQVFVWGPRIAKRNNIDYEEVKEATKDINVIVHSAYTTTGIWSGLTAYKTNTFKNQITDAKAIGASIFVLHINKILPENAVHILKQLKKIVKASKVKLGIEMVASKADPEKTYETPEKIDNLVKLLKNESWFGIVVDTAHLWAAGVDIRSYESMKDWLDRLTYKKSICLFHLNGSFSEKGSGRDKHAICFSSDDKIWRGINPHNSGVRAVVEFAKQHHVPIICEINYGNQKEADEMFDKIRELMK